MKKLLILGGSDLQVSIIKLAKNMGIYVITCDYLPNNPGHKFADEYYNISTTDKESVFQLAKARKVDGVLAYASDPAAPTAAWVCEKLGLPTNPYDSVLLLSRKDLFREYMKMNGFKVPESGVFVKYEEAKKFLKTLASEAIIKPVDSSGSKGIFKISPSVGFKKEFLTALSFSKERKIIIEEFIEKDGFQIGGDGLLIDGSLVFRCFGDIHFSKTNPLLPCSVSLPSLHSEKIKDKVHTEIQRLLSGIDMRMGGLNFDIIINKNGDVFILEIGARNGGNMIPELTEYCTGINMKEYCIKLALGMNCRNILGWKEKKFFSHFVIHSNQTAKLKSIRKTEYLQKHILYEHYKVRIGDSIKVYENSSDRLGIFILQYSSKDEMLDIIYNMEEYHVIDYE